MRLWPGSGSRRGKMSQVLETHFWSLTRYRIGYCLLGLDYAGNVIFYPAYRKQSFGGWSAVTLGAPGSSTNSFLSSDTSAVNVLEDGYPMHYKASKKLQAYINEERRKWVAEREESAKKRAHEVAAAAAAAVASAASGAPGSTASAATKPSPLGAQIADDVAVEALSGYDSDQKFRDRLAIKISNPRFFTRQLRVSGLATFLYKVCYFYLWAVLVSLILQGYLMFRSWVNPPARAGLKNMEEHLMHFPRLLFAGCVYGLAWLARTAQPVIDPVINFLSEYFPQINWGAASAENLAMKAEHLADDTHPAAKERKEAARQVQIKVDQDRRTWWTRVLMVLLALFSILCIL